MDENLMEEVKLLNKENDLFGTYDKALAIRDFIQLEENKTLLEKNNLIGIYGSWGIGKSSVMTTIKNNLDKSIFDIVWFDTWKYEKDENLPYSLFKFIGKDNIINQLKDKGINVLENVYGIFKSMTKGVELNLGIINFKPGEALDEAEKRDEIINSEKCLWEKIEEFEKEYKKIKFNQNKRLVVFLDDLDRCESENIISLISTIKLLLSVNPNIIFVIGIDKEAVTLALQNKYNNDFNKADEYLEKIFPINFSIDNNINTEIFKKEIGQILGVTEEDSEMILKFFNAINFDNSRRIKKVLRKYLSIKEYLKQKRIDLNNKYNVILVLYFIIIQMFYNDEYKYFLMKDKEKIFNKITLIQYDRTTRVKKENQFEQYYKKECYITYTLEKKYEIYKFLVRFSSYKINKEELKVTIYPQRTIFENYNWLGLFDDTICKSFIKFILEDNNFLDYLSNNKVYNDDMIYEMVKEVNNII